MKKFFLEKSEFLNGCRILPNNVLHIVFLFNRSTVELAPKSPLRQKLKH